ncbi:MAG: ATP-dependent zinc protease [Crocinitomicaceae bacterium]|nr:ATP-dependent zinc protease [Crocinitomicaceae bacterium]
MQLHKLMIVGNAEWCALPQLKIPAIRARIDSGAKTSSLHAVNIEEFYKNRQQWVRFEIHPLRIHTDVLIICEAPVFDYRLVKSSTGVAQPRYVIETNIEMGGEKWTIQVTLANRRSMGFQMLLGRQAMTHRMLINPSEDFQLTRYSRKQVREFYNIPKEQKIKTKSTQPDKKQETEVHEKISVKPVSEKKSKKPVTENKSEKPVKKVKASVAKKTTEPKKDKKKKTVSSSDKLKQTKLKQKEKRLIQKAKAKEKALKLKQIQKEKEKQLKLKKKQKEKASKLKQKKTGKQLSLFFS